MNAEIERALAAGAAVVYTQDWHPAHTPHFAADGGIWPSHCVQERGARSCTRAVGPRAVVRKGAHGEDGYSGFSMRNPAGGSRSRRSSTPRWLGAGRNGSWSGALPPTIASRRRLSTVSGSATRPRCCGLRFGRWTSSRGRPARPGRDGRRRSHARRRASPGALKRPGATPSRRRHLRVLPRLLLPAPPGPRPRWAGRGCCHRPALHPAHPASRRRRNARRMRHRPRHPLLSKRAVPRLQDRGGGPGRAAGPVSAGRTGHGGARAGRLADGRVRGRRRHGDRRFPMGRSPGIERVWICTPDKDLAQCVRGDRVVMRDRRRGRTVDGAGVGSDGEWRRNRSPTTWPWSATRPTASPGWRAGGRDRRPPSWPASSIWRGVPANSGGVARRRPVRARLNATLRARWADALLYRRLATLRRDAPFPQATRRNCAGPGHGGSLRGAVRGTRRPLRRTPASLAGLSRLGAGRATRTRTAALTSASPLWRRGCAPSPPGTTTSWRGRSDRTTARLPGW